MKLGSIEQSGIRYINGNANFSKAWESVVVQYDSRSGDRKITTPFLYLIRNTTFNVGTVRDIYVPDNQINFEVDGVNCDPFPQNILFRLAEPELEAQQRLADKFRSSDFNLPVTLGEIRESVRLGSDVLKLTKQFVQKLPAGRVISRGSKLLASAWLTYTYGVKPVVNDLHALLKFSSRDSYDFRIGASATIKDTREEFDGTRQRITISEMSKVKYGGRVRIGNPYADHIDRVNAFNPALLAWELIPLSLVADWFVNVGGYLDVLGTGLSFNSNSTIEGFVVKFRKLDAVTQGLSDLSGGPYITLRNYEGSQKIIRCERARLVGFPVASFPRVTVPTGTSQLLSAAALLRTIGLK